MPNDRSVIHHPWFWPALLVAAIVFGAIVEWVRTPDTRSTKAPQADAPGPPPRAGTPGSAEPTPGAPTPPRAFEAPEPPPIVHAEIPRAHPPPGTEPRIPTTGNRVLDQRRVLEDSARRWADSVRRVRPEILEQMRLGKMQERERLQEQMAALQKELRNMPANAALARRLETLQNNFYYLDRSIAYLENIQEESR